jgi:uroporphyrinogen-III synthase
VAARGWAGRRVLVVRGEDGRDWLADRLRAEGADVAHVAAYRRAPPQPGTDGQALLDAARAVPARHAFVFGSSEAVAHLRTLCPQADWAAAVAFAGHPRIAEAARAAGFGVVRVLPPQDDLAAGVAVLAAALAGLDGGET